MIRVSVCELPDNRNQLRVGMGITGPTCPVCRERPRRPTRAPGQRLVRLRLDTFDQAIWDSVVAEHDELIAQLGEFGTVNCGWVTGRDCRRAPTQYCVPLDSRDWV